MRPRSSKLRIVGLAWVLAAVALVVAVAGCGGSSEATGASKPGGSAAGSSSSQRIVKSDDKVTQTEGSTEIAEGNFPNGLDNDEISPTGAKPVEPCTLVTAGQARKILGAGTKVSEHMQGPTCVFQGSGREVTMVVMETPLQPLVKGARSAHSLTLAGHQAWCLRYEGDSVVADVGEGRVLQVSGSCPAATRLAAAALPHVPH
jgi:hypothetical protein